MSGNYTFLYKSVPIAFLCCFTDPNTKYTFIILKYIESVLIFLIPTNQTQLEHFKTNITVLLCAELRKISMMAIDPRKLSNMDHRKICAKSGTN